MRAIDPARSRIVLVGTPSYRDKQLADVPQVAANLTDLARVFTDPQLGGLPERNCITASHAAGVGDVGDLLHEAAEQAGDLLLFYYAGHGLLGRNGELYLSLRDTRFRAPEYSALRFETVRGTFLDSPAASRVVIVDSCYSGRAIGPTLGADEQAALAQLEINGTYTLTSAPPNSVALVRAGETHTAFTERLLRLLNEGSPQASGLLSLGDIYRHLHTRLRADGLPLPQQRGTATADLLGLVCNRQRAALQPAPLPDELREGLESRYASFRLAAVNELGIWLTDVNPRRALAARRLLAAPASLVTVPPTDRRGNDEGDLSSRGGIRSSVESASRADRQPSGLRDRATAVLAEAEHIAIAMTSDVQKARMLVEIAEALAVVNPDRTAALLDQAERVTERLTGYSRDLAVKDLVSALAATDPDRAERLAGTATSNAFKEWTLVEIARALATTDPDRAERTASTITQDALRGQALAHIAEALATTDPGRAEHIAATITDDNTVSTLASIAKALAKTDPDGAAAILDRAERTTVTLADDNARADALITMATALPITNTGRAAALLDQAEHITATITSEVERFGLLGTIVKALAAIDPDRAELVARRAVINDIFLKESLLAGIATALATTDPDRAERVTATLTTDSPKGEAVAGIATALAIIDPDRAFRLIATITADLWKAKARVSVARRWLESQGS